MSVDGHAVELSCDQMRATNSNSKENSGEDEAQELRIVIDNSGGYWLHNLGDVAMFLTCVARLRNFWPKAQISAVTADPEKLAAICPGVVPLVVRKPDSRLRDIWIVPWAIYNALPRPIRWFVSGVEQRLCNALPPKVKLRLERWNRSVGRREENSEITRKIREADLFVISGGGFFCDTWHRHARRILVSLRLANDNAKVIALFGQGLGPVEDEFLMKQLKDLRVADLVALREKRKGLALLRALGIEERHIHVSGDDSIEIAYEARKEELGHSIGVNLRVAHYSGAGKGDKQRVKGVVEAAADKLEADLIGLPISAADAADSDVAALDDMFRGHSRFLDSGADVETLEQVLARVGRCRVVISGSYHAAVFALSQGVPVIALVKNEYYSDKFLGLADMFGQGCDVLFLDDPDFNDRFARTFHQAWKSAPQIRRALLESARRQINLSWEAYRRVGELTQSRLS